MAELEQAALFLPPSLTGARPVAPLSASIAASRRPQFRWAGPRVALFQVCSDRGCQQTLQLFIGTDNVARPFRALPPGVVFWRVLTSISRGGLAFSPAWELFIPGGAADVPAAVRGLRYDANGDGFVDAAVREFGGEFRPDRLHVFTGGATGLDPSRETILPLQQGEVELTAPGDLDGDGFGEVAVQDARGTVIHAGSQAGVNPTPQIILPSQAAGSFARLAGGGDVNGDGYGDLFIGDFFSFASTGAVSLHLGSAAGPSFGPAWVLNHIGSGRFARLLAAADVNGDGFGDLAVIEDVMGGPAPMQGIRVFQGSAAGLESPEAGQFIERPSFISGGSAGDVDGDGFSDLVLLEPGALVVFRGGPAGLAGSPAQVIAVEPRPSQIQIGDFDGDGSFDLAGTVSTQTSSIFFTDDRILLYRGGPGGLSPIPYLTLMETDDFANNEINFGSGLGNGDFDRDGFEDLLVGASPPFPTPFFETSPSAAFVFRGSATGVERPAAPRLDGLPGFGSRVSAGEP
jgi:hypothetical protein